MSIPDDLIPLIFFTGILVIPIVAILTEHQRKMTRLLQEGRSALPASDPALTEEVRRLRELVAQQSIAIDNLAQKLDRVPPPVQDRLNA